MSKKDYYKILGISRDATAVDIKRAYRKLAHKYHPDVSKEADSEEKFKEIKDAYDVLKDPEKRQIYDQYGHAGFEQSHQGFGDFGGFEDIFSAFRRGGTQQTDHEETQGNFGGFEDLFRNFGAFGGQARRRKSAFNTPIKGENIHAQATLNLKEILFGTTIKLKVNLIKTCEPCKGIGADSKKDIATCKTCHGQGMVVVEQKTPIGTVRTQMNCPDCRGEGKIIMRKCSHCKGKKVYKDQETISIKIPHSLSTANTIVLRNMGHAGLNNGPKGDIYLDVHIMPHKYFRRRQNDLHLDLDVSYLDAILGGNIIVPTLDEDVVIKIPPGTKHNNRFTIPKHGFFLNAHSEKRGNLIVTVKIVTPTRLSKKENKELTAFKKESNFKVDNSEVNKF